MSIVPEQRKLSHVAIDVLKAQPVHEEEQYSHKQELPRCTDAVIEVLDHPQNSPAYKRDLESGRVTVTVNPAPTGLRFLFVSIFSIFSK